MMCMYYFDTNKNEQKLVKGKEEREEERESKRNTFPSRVFLSVRLTSYSLTKH